MHLVSSKYFSKNSAQCPLVQELIKLKNKHKEEELLIQEVRSIIRRSMMERISHPNYSKDIDEITLLDDEQLEPHLIYTIHEIEQITIKYRMHFIDIAYYKKEIPGAAEMKIEYLSELYNKKLNNLKILSYRECFIDTYNNKHYGIIFAPTVNGHYYLVYHWGQVSKYRKYLYFPIRTFETLAVSVILFTLIVTLVLPTHLITLDRTAGYWCGYRIGVFFHLLIFFSGMTTFLITGFFKSINKNVWDSI